MTLARKGAKSRRRITGLRSKTTEARTHVDRLRAANADLKKKLAEALEQQTATSEVLQVISSSSGELEPVFEAMLANATRLCEAKFGTLLLRDGDAFRMVAMHDVPLHLRKNGGVNRSSVLVRKLPWPVSPQHSRWSRSPMRGPGRIPPIWSTSPVLEPFSASRCSRR